MSLFEQNTVSVARVADRLKCSRDTVIRLLQSGELRGYRLTRFGWWRVIESSVLEYKQKVDLEYSTQPQIDGPRGSQ
jgi:excisionase family DNA binding protein